MDNMATQSDGAAKMEPLRSSCPFLEEEARCFRGSFVKNALADLLRPDDICPMM